jgi:YfiH family protein
MPIAIRAKSEHKMAAEFLESALLARAGFRHAFFTRRGGHSPPPFDSLHFGAAGHSSEALAANVDAAARALAVPPDHLFAVTQVHGRDVVVVRDLSDRARLLGAEGDVVATQQKGACVAVKIADCVSVLVGDRVSGAVAAVHSGWQGTEKNVTRAGVWALRDMIGGAGDLVAAIGPHIGVCCFEVGDDVAQRLQACHPRENVTAREFGPRPHVDLRKIVRGQLLSLGISEENIDDVPGCTQCDGERFFSFRRDRENSGRLLAAIVAR